MRVTAWRWATGSPWRIAEGLVEVDERAGRLVASALYGRPGTNGWGDTGEGEVAVEVDGATQLARPTRPLAPIAPVELLVLDVGHPDADWTRLVDEPAGPEGALATLEAAIRDLIGGSAPLASTPELCRRLTALDRRLAAPDGRPGGRVVDHRAAARAADEAQEHASAAAELAAEREALDQDLAATEASVAAARADERRLPGGPGAGEMPSARRLAADGVALDRLERALAARQTAVEEALAAGNTASVCRRALAARRPASPSAPAWIQPALLGLALALVGVAAVLVGRAVSGWAVVVAIGAASSAVAALLLPTRPSRPPLPVAADELDRRRQRADADQRHWEAERSARSAEIEALAHQLGLPAKVDADELARRRVERQRAIDERRRSEEADRRRSVARNTGDAAGDRRRALAGQRSVLDARVEAVERAWTAWRDQHGLPAWALPDDAVERFRAEAAGSPAPVDDVAELRQIRQGLVEELGRRTRELDRLVLARWLLSGAATAAAARAPGPPARPDGSPPADLRVRTGELLSLASGGRVVGVRVELPDRPVLSLADGGELALGADRDARVLADLCAVLAAGELAARPGRWPLVVRGLDAWPAGVGRQVVRQLLANVAERTQVLVVRSGTEATNGTLAADRAGIRVAVTPAE